MFGFQPQDLLIILIVALVIFGPSQLPKLARALGESLREFRKVTDEIKLATNVETLVAGAAPLATPTKPAIVLPKPPWRIFLSSVMKEMEEERARVKKAIESLPDLAQAWTWEEGSYASPVKTPEEEYLPKVSACEIFLLIVKDDITAPVRKEYETARQANKPMLVFVKKCERTPAAQELVDALGKEMTYSVFTDLDAPDRLEDLDDKVRKAVARLVIDKFEIDEAKRHGLEEQIALLEQQIAERDKRLAERDKEIGRLEKEKLILAGTTLAGPIITAAVLSATSQPAESKPAPVETPTPPTPEPPRSETPLSSVKIGRDGKRMILIPAGEFLRGTSDADILEMTLRFGWKSEWFDHEKPQRKIYLDAYYIGETPVTNQEYKKFVDETGRAVPYGWDKNWRTFPTGKDKHPVINVTWDDANAYARWAGGRLPTEAEWEKAARGTDGQRYPWGNEFDATRCNVSDSKIGATTPVGKYSPRGDSPYHVQDMVGNVWEWCADWYDAEYYKNSPARNPKGPDSEKGNRVLRGGSWFNGRADARCASRSRTGPDNYGDLVGFRVCSPGSIPGS